MLLKGKTAIVTGAASGIGFACAKRFAEEGASFIIIVDIAEEAAQAKATAIMDANPDCKVIAVKTDVTKEEDVKHVFEVLLQNVDHLDIMLNCAGISSLTPLSDFTVEKWDRTMAINVRSVFMFCKEAYAVMAPKKYGRIINMGSQAGKSGGLIVDPGYPASKAAVMNLTKSFAKICAADQITVNSVAPGLVATPMTTTYNYDPNTVPLHRIGTPEEMADPCVFLASDLARYITGACIDVNGGILMD